MDIRDKKVLVLGLGKSGLAAAEFLADKGAKVIATDDSASGDVAETASILEKKGISCRIGAPLPNDLDDISFILVSPGVPDENILIAQAIEKQIPVLSEPELASRFTTATIIAVTGTNGKTTTTTLIGEMLKAAGLESVVAGNIGYPMIRAIHDVGAAGFLVVEMSSFQLDHICMFEPKVAVLLNITEDHLDRHKTFSGYIASKSNIFMNQRPDDFAVINIDDSASRSITENIKARKIFTSKTQINETGAYLEGDMLVVDVGAKEKICRIDELLIIGRHNVDNALAAIAACACVGVKPEFMRRVLLDFHGLPHRLQKVGETEGINFYDDSKATNPDAVIKALSSFKGPVILLAGGRNKGYDFKIFKTAANVKRIEAFGEAAADIANDLMGSDIRVNVSKDLEAAFNEAVGTSQSGDIILLSPACASFDQYADYKARGDHFIKLATGYIEGRGHPK